MIDESQQITADGEAFCDALCCMYFLTKREIPHTTSFVPLRSLCVQLGNQSLLRLAERGGNRTYTSEQTMNEMVSAIGMTIEDSLLVSATHPTMPL